MLLGRVDALKPFACQRLGDGADRPLVVDLGQDHVPRRGPDRRRHHPPGNQRRDESAVVREATTCKRITDDAERELMLGLTRLEKRAGDVQKGIGRGEAARLDRHASVEGEVVRVLVAPAALGTRSA